MHLRTATVWVCALCLWGTVSAACTNEPAAPAAAVITLFDIQAQLAAGKTMIEPLGLPMAGRFSYAANNATVDVTPAFADGQAAAYVTTEFWTGFPKVWVQPMYVMVQDSNNDGVLEPFADLPAVFSVGPDSAFYSPYWHVFFVIVPQGMPKPDFRTSRAVLDAGYQLISGPPRLCSLAPIGTDITGYVRLPAPVPPAHPLLGTDIVGNAVVGAGWVDGFDEQLGVVSFGDDRFTYDENGVIDEAPLYVFRHQTEGLVPPKLAGLPSVGGEALPSTANKPGAPENRPAFGSLWRLYFVDLPATAGAIVPATTDAAQAKRQNEINQSGLQVVTLDAGALGQDIYFRPVLNATKCAAELTAALAAAPTQPLPTSACAFLDSQAKVQDLLPPDKVVRTEILVTCPWVTFAGQAVPVAAYLEPRP